MMRQNRELKIFLHKALASFLCFVFSFLQIESSFSQILEREKKNESVRGDEFIGSYMQDMVITYFNPDLECTDAFLIQESEKIAAYIIQNAKNLDKVLNSLGRELLVIEKKHERLDSQEFRRRLFPFAQALDAELNKENKKVRNLKDRILGLSILGAGLFAGIIPFLFPAKFKRTQSAKERVLRTLCWTVVGCACGAGLGVIGSQFAGREYQSVKKEPGFVLPNDESDDKNSGQGMVGGPLSPIK